MNLFLGLIISFIGTTIGSAMLFLMKSKLNIGRLRYYDLPYGQETISNI